MWKGTFKGVTWLEAPTPLRALPLETPLKVLVVFWQVGEESLDHPPASSSPGSRDLQKSVGSVDRFWLSESLRDGL